MTQTRSHLASAAEAATECGLAFVGGTPPRGYADQRWLCLLLTIYAKAHCRNDLLESVQEHLQRLVFFPAPLPGWWDTEVGSTCERSRPVGYAPSADQRWHLEGDCVSGWGAGVAACALAFEDQSDHLLYWAGKIVSGEEGRHVPCDFTRRATAAVPYNATLFLGVRGLLRSLGDDNTLCSHMAPPEGPIDQMSAERLNVQDAMKRLGKQLKKFVDPYTKASDPDGDLEAVPTSWVGFMVAFSKFAFSTRSAHQRLVTATYLLSPPPRDISALAEYLDRAAQHSGPHNQSLV